MVATAETPTPAETFVTIDYINWRGERSKRRIMPRNMWWGATDWHPEPQWLLAALDVDKWEERDFAMLSILGWSKE